MTFKPSDAIERCITEGLYSVENRQFMCHALEDLGKKHPELVKTCNSAKYIIYEKIRKMASAKYAYIGGSLLGLLQRVGLVQEMSAIQAMPYTIRWYKNFVKELRKKGQ